MQRMIKRIIVGVAISLIVFLIKKNVFARDISSVWSPFTNSNTVVVSNVDTQAVFDISGSPWSNWGTGTLTFTFSVIKVSGDPTAPLVVPSGATAGNYACNISSTSTGNSTFTGSTYSATCNMNMGSTGLNRIVIYLTPNQQNNTSSYRITISQMLTYEQDNNLSVNVDTSSTTNAINNQITNDNQNTQTIINNQDNNTNQIIDNQNNNTNQIIDNQNNLLGSKCNNLLLNSLEVVKANNTGGTWNGNVYTYRGVSFTYNSDGSITATGQATSNANFYINRSGASNYKYTILNTGVYYLTSHEPTGSNSTWKLQYQIEGTSYNVFGTGSSKERVLTLTNSTVVSSLIVIYSGYNPNGATFKPMISATTGSSYCFYNSYDSKLDTTNNSLNEVNNNLNETNDMLKNHNVSSSTGFAQDFFANYNLNTHGLTAIITAPLRLFSSLIGANCTSLRFQLPFVHNEVQLQCMSSIYETHFSSFLLIYRLITDGIIAYWVSVKVFQKVKGFLDPTDDKVEVFDL